MRRYLRRWLGGGRGAWGGDIIYVLIFIEIRNKRTKRQFGMTQNRRGGDESIGGDYHRNRAWQNGTGSENMALNEFMSRQVRRKQQPEFNPGLVPGVAIPCSASSSLLFRRIRILIIHTSLPLHFISYCCHCTLSLFSNCDLCSPALPAAAVDGAPDSELRLVSHVNFTPTQWKGSGI